MRIWSIHPSYYDTKALVAQWREGLGAVKSLNEGVGYHNHPQLNRFKEQESPKHSVYCHLFHVFLESRNRKRKNGKPYNFNFNLISTVDTFSLEGLAKIPVTEGQILYEINFLLDKMYNRSPEWAEVVHNRIKQDNYVITPHPLFNIVPGDIEAFEKVKTFPYRVHNIGNKSACLSACTVLG